MNGEEIIITARRHAQNREMPPEMSMDWLWALGVDAFHDRKVMKRDIFRLQLKAGIWGAVGGLTSGIGMFLIALAARLI